jgi:hypothetical protein
MRLPGWFPGAGNSVEIIPTGNDGSEWRLIKEGGSVKLPLSTS